MNTTFIVFVITEWIPHSFPHFMILSSNITFVQSIISIFLFSPNHFATQECCEIVQSWYNKKRKNNFSFNQTIFFHLPFQFGLIFLAFPLSYLVESSLLKSTWLWLVQENWVKKGNSFYISYSFDIIEKNIYPSYFFSKG